MRSVLAKASVAVVAIGSLAACGGGSGGAKPSGSAEEPSAHASTAAPTLKLDVPAGYDTARGWQLSGKQLGQYAVLPKAGAIAVMTSRGSTYRVTVRDAVTGEVRWTGKPFDNLSEGWAPGLFVVPAGGKEYLVTWSRGEQGEDALSKAKQVYAVDVYAADGSGDAVAPAHHVEVPASDYGTGRVTDGGERLLIPVTDERTAALDVATGRTTTYDTDSLKAPGCSSCSYGNEIAALTDRDPVVLNEGAGAFGIPGSWDDDRIAPAEADPATGAVWPGTGGHLIARWEQKNGGSKNVWAVLDGRTGQVQASALCAKPFIGSAQAPGSALSPNGRYLVSDHLAFDLQSKKGYCFEETDDTKPLSFDTVTDDGTAYGTSLTKGESLTGTKAPVELSLATGTPKPLPEGAEVPAADLAGVGVFTHDEGNVPYLVVYRHKG
ncbi:hypothetical protein JK361_20095 [Streptomyces sp. 5-8]|uniref:Lipoprotein n=1 Tax=Streptomyces musisoli TaxID=2802280 RepID=A0ABS1P3E0_9ACTN|nr:MULTISPECIES: hypothetical protein [Streptomyces]MBL1106878.1 hypothetical protein [Streptomyces musisoli]MBY8844865.1 hypothetical protein [Streptomyces sp. SP2-10]